MEDNIQKQTWVALRHALAKQAHCTEKEAANFLDSLIHQLTLCLQDNQPVRINNLGTFRLQAVSPRKSVHVGTGEAITIAGYNKLTFAPEASVKTSINDAASPMLTPQSDPIRKLGEQADEILDILADMGQTPTRPATDENNIPDLQVAEEPEPANVAVETTVATQIEESGTDEPTVEPNEEPTDEPTGKPDEEHAEETPIEPKPLNEEQPKKKKTHVGLTVLLTVIFFIILCIGAYFFLQHKLVTWMDSLHEKISDTEVVVAQTNDPVAEEPILEEPIAETPTVDSVAETSADMATTEVHPEYLSFITTEEMHADSRLAWMAYRYWGKKDLWVYIYDANREHISNPNLIKTGTPIHIPRLTKEQQDLNNPDTQRFIKQILSELE